MSIIYTLTSHDSKNYGTIKFNANPLVDSKIRYRIKSLSTFSSFSITTDDDYIIISREGTEHKYYFEDKGSYNNISYEVEQIINNDIIDVGTENEYHIYVSYTDTGLLKFQCNHKINIIDASHRVKMLLGLYHSSLPLKEDFAPSELRTGGSFVIVSDSIPLNCFGNVLYIRCKSGLVVGTNEKGSEQYKNICYKSIELLIPGLPLVSKSPGYLMTSTKEDLSQLEFELVDFMMEPIVLHSPMHLTLEIYYNTLDLTPINVNEFQFNNLAI